MRSDRQPVKVIDAHVHLGPPKYAAADAFAAARRAEGIAGAVLVQHLGNTDNSYLAAQLASDPSRLAAIAIVDRVDQVAGVFAAGFAGLRLAPSGLAGADGVAVFDAVDEHGGIVSVTGPFDDVVSDPFRATVRAHAQTHFRIEHVGGFQYGAADADRRQFRALLRLADEPNVSLMWSGFFVNAGSDFPHQNTHAYLAETLAAFGSSRIMWSGSWNRADLAAGDYRREAEVVGLVTDDDAARADILAHTACRIFGLAPVADQGALHV
ncbi:amidohydrolase family protein [Dactylosporangium sp. CA-233914]|uniref:amidohydrolase family protein n=1 Tax=Dactylosporangium sp. CA-233914 TaxID=3239934 RepID=UPI003D944D54